jgi:crossover junction endodeoxyribonuclease RuvC
MVVKRQGIILGIDPGYVKTGYGIVEVYKDGEEKERYRLISCGTIRLDNLSCSAKLFKLEQTLLALVKVYRPTIGMVEDVFMAHNPQTIIKLGKILGVIQCTLGKHMEIYSYSPLAVRKIITSSGRATKIESLARILEILDPTSVVISGLDTSDAIAIALSYALKAPEQPD